MTPEEFAEDVTLCRKALEEITGEPVVAYRAPSFSITLRSMWALDILTELGFQFDSSVFPVYHPRYGVPNAERHPHQLSRPGGDIWEFPPSVLGRWGFNIPVSGGGYFRMYPLWFTIRCFSHMNRRTAPFMFYIHPWEIDPDQPRIPSSHRTRIRHYAGLGGTEGKLDRLLDRFQFGTLTDAIRPFVTPMPAGQVDRVRS
jgi:polysaccharide deacetylase family protein (PEP-CTERM system associated)